MKISREQFQMFQRTCKRFDIPKDSIHLNLKIFEKTCRHMFKRRYVLTTCVYRRRNRSVLVQWIKRSGLFAPHQKQSQRWRRMRWGRRWTEVVRNKSEETAAAKKKKRVRPMSKLMRHRVKMLQKFKMICERQSKKSQKVVVPTPVSPSKSVETPKALKKVDDDWWGGESSKAPVKKPFETLCLLSSDEEEDKEKRVRPAPPILSEVDIKKEKELDISINMEVAEDLIEEDLVEENVIAVAPKPATPALTNVKVIRLIKPAQPGAAFTFIDSLISKLSNNSSATLPTITLKKSTPLAHCSKTVEPLRAAPPVVPIRVDKQVPSFKAPSQIIVESENSHVKEKAMMAPAKRGPKRHVTGKPAAATPDTAEPDSSDTELFLGFHANEINEKTNSPPKYKNINHSAFLGSDTNFDDLNLNENDLLEPMHEHRLNNGMVDAKAKAPKLQMPKRPDNMKKARTVAEKKIMLQNKNDIRIKMIESESKIFHELNKRNRMAGVMGGEASTASWARSAEFKNYELMVHLQNQDVPFTRDSWRALAFLKTEDRKYYFQNLRIDGMYVKLTGSRGNLNSQVLGGKVLSWPGLRYRPIGRKETGKCCKPIELPKNLWIQMIVNDEIVSFAYDTTRRRKQDVKTYKLAADQLGMFNNAGSVNKSLLDSSRSKRPGPLSSKLRRRQHSDDETDLATVQMTEVFKMPTLQLEVFPKINVPLDSKVRPYLKYLLPFENITPEWANFAVSTFMPSQVNRRDANSAKAPTDKIVSYTFNMPYANNETQILVRNCRKKRRRREWPTGQPHMLDEKLNLEEPLTFAAHVDPDDVVETAIAEMLTDMTDSVAISCNEDAFTRNDPDLVYDKKDGDGVAIEKASEGVVVDGTDADLKDVDAKNKQISKRIITELRRLNATFITAANKEKDDKKDKVCTETFCLKGCLCDTLNQYIPALRQKHCSKSACMFECLCGYIEEQNELSSLTHDDVRSLRDKATARLAPIEKEFTPTIVLTNNRPILIAGKEHESRRSKKAPKRYDDYMVTKEDVPVQSTREVGPTYRSRTIVTKVSETIEVTEAPRRPKPLNTYSTRVEPMLHVNVVLNRLNLKEVEPFCMVHSLFKCFCRLEKTQGIPFSFHDPRSIAEALKVRAEVGKAPEERPQPKTLVTNAELLRHSKRAAEIDHGMYNSNPLKQARAKSTPGIVWKRNTEEDVEELLDSLAANNCIDQAQRCLPIDRIYSTRNFFQKENMRKKISDNEKKNPQLLDQLRVIVDKCFEDYKDEVHRQRLGFPKLEIECRMTETGDKKDPIMIFIKDSEEKILNNPILKNLADGTKLLIFTGAKKYYIKKQDYEKNGKYLMDSLRKQTDNPIYLIQRDPVTMAAKCRDLLQSSVAALESIADSDKETSQMTSVQKLNAMTTATMQNICDIQRENSKQLMEPKDGQIYVYGWEHLLRGFEQNYLVVWEVTFNDDTRAVLITIKNVRPKLANMASVVNVKYLTLATEDVSMVTRMLMLRLDTDQMRNLALLLKGTMSYWVVCGFLKSKECYVENGLKVRPTPNTHPQLSKKISVFYEQMFGPKKSSVPLLRALNKVDVVKNSIMAGKMVKPADPVLPVISNVSSLNPLVVNAAKPLPVETKSSEKSVPSALSTVSASVPPVIVVGKPTISAENAPQDLESTIPLTSIIKDVVIESAPPKLTTPSPAPLDTMDKKLNASTTNIALVQHNIQNTLALPIQNFAHRWFMLSVVNDFSDIYIPQWKSFLAYDKILRAIVMAQRVHKTVQLQSNCKFPQVFAVPESINRIFLGPYNMADGVDFKLCQNIDNEMMLREEYETRFGVKRGTQKTTGCWLYLKSITARKWAPGPKGIAKLPVAKGTPSSTQTAPVQNEKRKSEGPPSDEVVAVKKFAAGPSLLKNPAQRKAAMEKNVSAPVLPKVTPPSEAVPTAIVRPKPVAAPATSTPSALTSSCIINRVPVIAPITPPPNPVGHLANQQIFPKFNIQFTTANQTMNTPPATVTAPQRLEAQTQPHEVEIVPVASGAADPVYVIVNFPSVPATTDQQRSTTPVANIDLTDDDARKVASEEIDLTSDDEQVYVTKNVQVVNPMPARRKSTNPITSTPPLIIVAPHSHDNCTAPNCAVCSAIKVTKVVPSSTSDKLCDEIRKRLSTQPTVKPTEEASNSTSMPARPAGLAAVKRNSLPTLPAKSSTTGQIKPKPAVVSKIGPLPSKSTTPPPLALIMAQTSILKSTSAPPQLTVKPHVAVSKPRPRSPSPKPVVTRKLPTLKSAAASSVPPKASLEPQTQSTVSVTILKPIMNADIPKNIVQEEQPLPMELDEPEASSTERVQFGYFVSSFIFLGRFKAKETADKKYSVKFPTRTLNIDADRFEWKVCGTANEAGHIINKYLVELVYATIPHTMPMTWKFITNRNVFNSYKDHENEHLDRNMIISKHGIHSLLTYDFEKFRLRDIHFYHEVLALKLAKMFMDQQDYISLSEKYSFGEEKTEEIVKKAKQFIVQLKLKEQKLQQLKKTCLAINKRLRSAISGPKSVPSASSNSDTVVDLANSEADEGNSSGGDTNSVKTITVVNVADNNHQQKIINKIRNVKIISKLPKDLTVKTTSVENSKAKQQHGQMPVKRKAVAQYGPAVKRVGGTTVRTITDLTIDSDDSSSEGDADSKREAAVD